MTTEEKVLKVVRADDGKWLYDGKDNWVKELSTFGDIAENWAEKTQEEKDAWETERYNEANDIGDEQ